MCVSCLLSEVLFSRQGKVRKVKLYTAADGTKKGDALVTFAKAESALSACQHVSIM